MWMSKYCLLGGQAAARVKKKKNGNAADMDITIVYANKHMHTFTGTWHQTYQSLAVVLGSSLHIASL